MANQGSFQYVPVFVPEFNPIKDRKKLNPPLWEDFHRHGKQKERKIKKRAVEDGNFGIPSDEQLSNTENEILADAEEYQHKLANIGSEYFTKLENRINSYSDFLSLENFKTLFNRLTPSVQDYIDKTKLKLSQLQGVHDKNIENYEQFKKVNRLRRPASGQNYSLYIVVILFLFVLEFLINNFLVADYLEGGGLESIFLTFGVGFINVFISFLLGYYLLKYITHINMVNRILAASALVLHIVVFLYLNWMYSAFRTQKIMEFMEENNANSTLENISVWVPWAVDIPFTSLIVLVIGFCSAIFSLLDGYLIDDHYPGYGKNTRTYNKSRKSIEIELRNLASTTQKIFKDIEGEGEKIRTTLMLTVNAWSEETNSLQNGFDLYKKKILGAEKDINYMLDKYNIENRNARNKDK